MPVPDSQLLVDIWSDESLNSISKVLLHNTTTSIGPVLWNDADLFSKATSSLVLYPQPQTSEPVAAEDLSIRRRRNNMVNGKLSAKMLYYELTKSVNDPHLLVAPYYYEEEIGPVPDLQQPFGLVVHPQVAVTCDLHGHLSDAEVIGLLAGKWDAETRTLFVQAAFPCTSTSRSGDDGSTDVELDPEAEFQVRNAVEKLDMIVVGWYHSHPLFKPDPSITDIFNQQQYQQLMRDESTGCEPFVGLIVSTFDKDLTGEAAKHQWFCVTPYSDADGGARQVIQLPLILNAQYLSLSASERQPERSDIEEVIALLDSLTVSPKTPGTKSPKEEAVCCADSSLLCEEVSVKSGRGRKKNSAAAAAATAAETREAKVKGTKGVKGTKSKIIPLSKQKAAQLLEEVAPGEPVVDVEAVSATVSVKSKGGRKGAKIKSSAKSDVSSDSSPNPATETSVDDTADQSVLKTETEDTPELRSGLEPDAKIVHESLLPLDSTAPPESESIPVKLEPVSPGEEVSVDNRVVVTSEEVAGDVPLAAPKKAVRRKPAVVAVVEPRVSQRERKPRVPMGEYLSGDALEEELLLPAKRKRKAAPLDEETVSSDAPPKRKSARKSSASSTDAESKPAKAGKPGKKTSMSVEDPRHFSLILSLQDREFESADLARQLLSGVPAHCRFVALIIVALGFYYSRKSPRIDLTKKWRLIGTKFDKIRASVASWTDLLGLSPEGNTDFLNRVLGFLESSWRDHSKGVTRSRPVDTHEH